MVNKTEKKFSEWCRKEKFFCIKLQTGNDSGNKVRQVSDFIVSNNKGVYAVEAKEHHGHLFSFDRLTQKRKLMNMTSKTNKIKPLILLNFTDYNKVALIPLSEMIKFEDTLQFKNGKRRKSLALHQIPDNYLYTWKTLNTTPQFK